VTIYTGDIEQAPDFLDLGCIKLQTEQVFLSKFNGNEIYNDLKIKVENNQKLTDEDVMRFIILPLTKKDNKQDFIELTVNLAKEIIDEEKQGFIIAGILSATDKFIDKDYSNKLREWLRMTKVGRLFEEEKLEYAQKCEQETRQETKKEIARSLLSDGIDILSIMKATKLSKDEVLKLKEEISA
jgi:predicted transposase/invertase (TIGR01784 family)